MSNTILGHTFGHMFNAFTKGIKTLFGVLLLTVAGSVFLLTKANDPDIKAGEKIEIGNKFNKKANHMITTKSNHNWLKNETLDMTSTEVKTTTEAYNTLVLEANAEPNMSFMSIVFNEQGKEVVRIKCQDRACTAFNPPAP